MVEFESHSQLKIKQFIDKCCYLRISEVKKLLYCTRSGIDFNESYHSWKQFSRRKSNNVRRQESLSKSNYWRGMGPTIRTYTREAMEVLLKLCIYKQKEKTVFTMVVRIKYFA